MTFLFSISYSLFVQFDLVCEYSSLAKLSHTLFIAGQGLGALVFTKFSDRYGRKPVIGLCNLGLLICGLVIAYAPNFAVYACFKLACGTMQQVSIILKSFLVSVFDVQTK